MVVAGGRHGEAQQILVLVDGFDDGRQKQEELGVFIRRVAGFEQIDAGVGGNRPVVVLARSVDAVERFFMQQGDEVVLFGDALDDFHRELVVVDRDVRRREDRGELVLGRGDFVVFRFGANAKLPQLLVELVHEFLDAGLNGAEIVVFHFLVFRGRGAKQGAAGVNQVFALLKVLLVDEEVFLLGTERRFDGADVLVAEKLEHAQRLPADGLHRAKQRRFFVERESGIGTKGGRNAQDAVFDERVACRIPRRVAAGFKRGAKAAVWKAGRVGFAFDEFFAGKFHDDRSIVLGIDEAVVFFGGDAGHWLEPVRKVGGAFFNRPNFHRVGDGVGDFDVERFAVLNGFFQFLERFFREPLAHRLFVKYVGAVHFCDLIHIDSPS